MDKTRSWYFLDGASKETNCGYHFYLYLSQQKYFTFMENIGVGSNTYNEFMAFIFLLKFTRGQEVNDLKVSRDSSLVIKFMWGISKVYNINLMLLDDHVKDASFQFYKIGFVHVYHELNQTTDELSKDGLSLLENQYTLWEYDGGRVVARSKNSIKNF